MSPTHSHGVGDVSSNATPLPSMAQTRARLRYLGTFVRPHRRHFTIAVAASTLMTITALLIPFMFKQALDRGHFRDPAHVDMRTVQLFVALALVAALASWAASAASYLYSVFGYRVLNDLRVALFAHVQRQGLDFFHTMRTGTVISRLTNDVDALENLITDGVFMIFSNVLTLVGIEVFFFVFLDWRLALAVNVVFPVMLLATLAFRYYSARAYRRTRERLAIVTAFLAEALGGIRIVQAFAAEERVAREFDQTNEHYRRANMETIYQSAAYYPFVDLLSVAATGIVLWYGGFLNTHSALALGVLFAFITYLNDFFDPIQQLSQFYSSFLSAMAALDKIMLVMETEPTILDKPDARRLPTVRGEVQFDAVSFSYGEDAPEVLHHVDFHVRPGETVALVGHTGAGKSTMVKLLARFYDPTHGRVLLDGVDLRDLDSSWLRSSLGIVPQEGFLFSATIKENIRFGRPDASDADVQAAARAVGADQFVEELELQYDTPVGERGGHLSAGQRQLVAFARAMLADPRLLVLDEATSSVDVATEMRLSDGLQTLVAGRTSFIVAHRLTTIRGADRIMVIDDGRIVESGTHDELAAGNGFYADLYGSWSGEPETIEQRLAASSAPAEPAR